MRLPIQIAGLQPAFVYTDHDSGRETTILGYPIDQLDKMG
jgi:hypothetical protein